MKRFFFSTLFTLGFLILSACQQNVEQVSISTPTEEITTSPTKTATITPSPTLGDIETPTLTVAEHYKNQECCPQCELCDNPEQYYCVTQLTDWKKYTYSTLDTLLEQIITSPSGEPEYYAKTLVQYKGQVLLENQAQEDFFGNRFFLFEENGITHELPVLAYIEYDLHKLQENTEITIFLEKSLDGWHEPMQTVVIGFSIGSKIADMPEYHWHVEVVQNGRIYSENNIAIENRPFTIRVFLPRRTTECIPSVLMNAQFLDNKETENLIGIDLNPVNGVYPFPKNPFFYGNTFFHALYNSNRTLLLSKKSANNLFFGNCFSTSANKVTINPSYAVFEMDIFFYIDVDKEKSLSEESQSPVSALGNKGVELLFFYGQNDDAIIDENEIRSIVLEFTNIP